MWQCGNIRQYANMRPREASGARARFAAGVHSLALSKHVHAPHAVRLGELVDVARIVEPANPKPRQEHERRPICPRRPVVYPPSVLPLPARVRAGVAGQGPAVQACAARRSGSGARTSTASRRRRLPPADRRRSARTAEQRAAAAAAPRTAALRGARAALAGARAPGQWPAQTALRRGRRATQGPRPAQTQRPRLPRR